MGRKKNVYVLSVNTTQWVVVIIQYLKELSESFILQNFHHIGLFVIPSWTKFFTRFIKSIWRAARHIRLSTRRPTLKCADTTNHRDTLDWSHWLVKIIKLSKTWFLKPAVNVLLFCLLVRDKFQEKVLWSTFAPNGISAILNFLSTINNYIIVYRWQHFKIQTRQAPTVNQQNFNSSFHPTPNHRID